MCESPAEAFWFEKNCEWLFIGDPSKLNARTGKSYCKNRARRLQQEAHAWNLSAVTPLRSRLRLFLHSRS